MFQRLKIWWGVSILAFALIVTSCGNPTLTTSSTTPPTMSFSTEAPPTLTLVPSSSTTSSITKATTSTSSSIQTTVTTTKRTTTTATTLDLPHLIKIAASNSPNPWKQSATVICEGKSDQIIINKYVITGHDIELGPGTFNCSGIIFLQSNMHVFGQGDTTIINSTGGGLYLHDINNVELDHLQITGVINNAVIPASVYIDATTGDRSGFSIHDIKESARGGFLVSTDSRTISNVSFANCDSYRPDTMGFFMDGEGRGSLLQDFIFYNCTVENAGSANTRYTDWVTGFDFAEGESDLTVNRLSVISCAVNGSWEADFHFEAAPRATGIVILDCYAANAGQKPSPTYGYGFLLPSDHANEYIFQGNAGSHNKGAADVYDAAPPYLHNLPYDVVFGSSKQVARISQNNCTGLIVDSGDHKDLYLYSIDSNPVNEKIELNAVYMANDGKNYSFDNTQIIVQFTGYAVIRLTRAE